MSCTNDARRVSNKLHPSGIPSVGGSNITRKESGMKIQIKETGEIKYLKLVDPETGVDWVQDLIGNGGALSDGQFEWDDEAEMYVTTEETYKWWSDYVEGYEETENEIRQLADEFGVPVANLRDLISKVYAYNEWEYHREDASDTLERFRKKQQSLTITLGRRLRYNYHNENDYIYIDTRTDNPHQIAEELISGAGWDESMRGNMINTEVAATIAAFYQEANSYLLDYDGEVMDIERYVLDYLDMKRC